MIISNATTLTVIIVTLICFAILCAKYRKAKSGPLTIKRRVILLNYSTLVIYLFSYFLRVHDDETEILSVPAMVMLYCLWESFLLTCTTFSNGKLYRNIYALLFYNAVPLALLIPVITLSITQGSTHIHKFSDFIGSLSNLSSTELYARAELAMVLIACKIAMLVAVTNQQKKYSKQISAEKGDLKGSKRRVHIYMTWAGLLIFMTLGQLTANTWYHIGLKLCVMIFVLYTTRFYLNLHKRLIALENDSYHRGLSIKETIDNWLNKVPFPLSEPEMTLEKTADSIGITAAALSYYIYEFAGKTYLSWLSECRMDHCKRLLHDEQKNISEIAFECGYSDLAAMSKAFKRKFGIAPTLYRREYKRKKIAENNAKVAEQA